MVACFVDIIIEEISSLKYGFLKKGKIIYAKSNRINSLHTISNIIAVVDHNVLNGNLYVPYLYYALTNAVPVAFGAFLVAYVEVIEFISKIFEILLLNLAFDFSQSLPEVVYHW